MKKYRVPIFTEEYAINICIGTIKEIEKGAKSYGIKSDNLFSAHRGRAYNCFPDKLPFITINGDLPAHMALATLAHEASHAIDYIIEYVGINDRSGEFRGHGIAAVMRTVGRKILRN